MKKLILFIGIVIMSISVAQAQLKFTDLIKISDLFNSYYKPTATNNSSTSTRSIYQVKKLGYDLSHLEYSDENGLDYFEQYDFVDLVDDGTKEILQVSVSPSGRGGRFVACVSLTTDNFAQYLGWLDDISKESKYVNQYRRVDEESYKTGNSNTLVNYDILFQIPVTNSSLPPRRQGLSINLTPNTYKIKIWRYVP